MNRRPNIVFVFPDQLRQAAVGCYGQDPVVTPNLDRFAAESRVLTHASATRPVCSPYRAMLFTGQYPFTNGVPGNCNTRTAPRGNQLATDAKCFSDVLKDSGYCCGYIGKLHLDSPASEPPYDHGEGPRGDGVVWDAFTPPGPRRHGFDFWYSYGCCDNHLHPHYWTGNDGPEKRIDPHEWSVKHETDVALRFLRNEDGAIRDPEKPFCLVVSHNPPHNPFNHVPEEYRRFYEGKTDAELLNRPNVNPDSEVGRKALANIRNYLAAVSGIDEQFGRILRELDTLGLAGNTLVIFTSDHGEMMGGNDRMHKSVYYDESLLVPFLVRGPGIVQPGRDDLLIGAPDIYPTLLGLVGLADRIPPQVQGRDYSAAFRGGSCDRPTESLYLWPGPIGSSQGDEPDMRGLRTHRHLFVVERRDGKETALLFDSQTDPYQMRNVAEQQPQLVDELRRRLEHWLVRTADPWVTPHSPVVR